MNETNRIPYTKILLSLLLGVAIVYLTSTYVINTQTQVIEDEVQILVTKQASVVSSIAEITSRGGADKVAETIIVDCPSDERTKFDDLLSRLNQGIRTSELSELDRLFNRCGSFFAKRKAVMVSRLDREVDVLNNYVELLSTITSVDRSVDYKIAKWKELVSQEKRQSELFDNLVLLQGDIIFSLLSGSTPASDEISNLLAEVSSTQGQLSETIVETSSLRSELIGI